MTTKSSKMDPRVIRTRQLIRDAFLQLIQEYDLEKITVNRLAERATINRVTFYLHYRDIPDMLNQMADNMTTHIRKLLEDVADQSSTAKDEWPELVRLIQHFADHSASYKIMLGSRRLPIFTERLSVLMMEFIKSKIGNHNASSKTITPQIPNDIAAWYGSSAFLGTIVIWLRNDMPYTPAFLAKQLLLMVPFKSNADSS
ncbi:TetR/AcrR family transcriptional regulator [Paenibacillus sp. Leaf72]|uniref:TetR/AcrR family transcriptional regulator n=1 Tax=Paenibacillus sp. Leaf72 TaxID=1736234 RepID=UPI0006F3A50C|nr:TetR/AcrR family transcriptional regulator [Paenibacillus sp. Leaf72]KQO10707.1 TetR family transcriptional regulator [Paenibacillus sp. Leaf72]